MPETGWAGAIDVDSEVTLGAEHLGRQLLIQNGSVVTLTNLMELAPKGGRIGMNVLGPAIIGVPTNTVLRDGLNTIVASSIPLNIGFHELHEDRGTWTLSRPASSGGGSSGGGANQEELDAINLLAQEALSIAGLAATKASVGATDFDFVAEITTVLNS